MSARKLLLLLATALTTLPGCFTAPSGPTVLMRVSGRSAHISLGKDEVQPGDMVALFTLTCRLHRAVRRTTKPSTLKCSKEVRGTGTVTKVLNDRYAVAEFEEGPTVEEGDLVERYVPPEGKGSGADHTGTVEGGL